MGGGDAAADVAGVASAIFPATSAPHPADRRRAGGQGRLAGRGVSAAVLTATPIGAPLLLSDGDDLPPVTADTLNRLKPKGLRPLEGRPGHPDRR